MRLTRGIASFAALGLIGSQPVFAQYVDNTIALRALPPPPMHFPNPMAMMQQIQAIEAAKAQAARDRAEALLIEQQTAVLQDQRRQGYYQQQQPSSTPQSVAPAPNPIIEKWMMSAQPRMHLYADFEKVVFSPDLVINEKMIGLMSDSNYAADIAYYLGTHRAEALAISSMPTLSAAKAISDIEKRFIPRETRKR